MVRARRSEGWTLLEMIIVLAIFSVLLTMVTGLYIELIRVDADVRSELLEHPELPVLLERFGRDVLDSRRYPNAIKEWSQTAEVLLVEREPGSVVVWDFSQAGLARRIELEGGVERSLWTARGLPAITISAEEIVEDRMGLRMRLTSEGGDLIYDRIFQPRPR